MGNIPGGGGKGIPGGMAGIGNGKFGSGAIPGGKAGNGKAIIEEI